eukprot:NODE_20324_length_803_cov_4.065089.p4 GENE.NODE_20324_length_803_cov_4.065089~~NODE_20324_length_803_cov_4.065089.p4  ORF type:complete len:64 (+),score=2.71 NODE_20324_length_803_cov_4.065089:370-561(+)
MGTLPCHCGLVLAGDGTVSVKGTSSISVTCHHYLHEPHVASRAGEVTYGVHGTPSATTGSLTC